MNLAESIWTSVEKHQNHGLSGVEHGFRQLVLHPEQIQVCPVTKMGLAPCLSGRLLVVSKDKNHRICFLCCCDRGADEPSVFFRIGKRDNVLIPRAADRNLASFAVHDIKVLADLLLDALQDRGEISWLTAVPAEQCPVSIRADDCQSALRIRTEWKSTMFVLQQRDGFLSSPLGSCSVFFEHLLVLFGIDLHVWIFVQPELEFELQDGGYQLVNERFSERALLYKPGDFGITICIR